MTNNVTTEQVVASLIEVDLPSPDHFLIVKETLTRMGIGSNKTKTLYPSCVLLHKKGSFFIVHFKEMFLLDRKNTNITDDDIKRRNTIAWLLNEWDLVKVKNTEIFKELAPVSSIKIVPAKEKKNWTITPKYQVGSN